MANTTRVTVATGAVDYPIAYLSAQCSDGSQLAPVQVALHQANSTSDGAFQFGPLSELTLVAPDVIDGATFFEQYVIQ